MADADVRPASVTTVGATTGVPETAASLSAGGFSNYFETPDYQSSAVDAYLSGLGNTYSDLFNASGRAYPDVSAYGQNVMIANGGEMEPVDGTSCAAPIFASVVALLNDRRLAKGHGPLGFLNPWLYANAGAFTDITKGSNPGCGTDGFPATEGWDPVTGLGSPNFAALIDALKL
jgi:tripeptidyl-peptidase-1